MATPKKQTETEVTLKIVTRQRDYLVQTVDALMQRLAGWQAASGTVRADVAAVTMQNDMRALNAQMAAIEEEEKRNAGGTE